MPPTGFHYTIVVLGAMDWLFKALSSWLINRLKNLVACESGPGLEPIAEQFPHSYTKRLSKRVLLKKKNPSNNDREHCDWICKIMARV